VTAFVDSSAFYAAADRGDTSHERSKVLLAAEQSLITTDHVLVETWLLLRHRLGRPAAERFWNGIRAGASAIEPVGVADLETAWSIGQAFVDQDFSITDRTSFAVMQRLDVHRVVTLDADFAIYRFGPRRDRAFDIVR
jgi:predicted nucleic acid-binding protein